MSSLIACDDYLTTEPQTVITDEDIWNDRALVTNVLADFYDRIPEHQSILTGGGNGGGPWNEFTSYDEALYSGVAAGAEFRNSLQNYPFDSWVDDGTFYESNEQPDGAHVWEDAYGLIRDINLALDNVEAGSLTAAQKTQFDAELRFVRALAYFELVKRVGGVPIVTEQLIYDFSGDASNLQVPRASETEVYDFIASEMDAIAGNLGNEGNPRRANRFTALALKSRAMLYAGSIARHNDGLVPALPGGEVGIPPSRANEYFQKSLEASRTIIQSGPYSLVRGPNPSEAFQSIFLDKGNPEVILAKDYAKDQGKAHFFTMQIFPQSIPHALRANWIGGAVSASLNLVENFDYLNGSSGEMMGVGDGTTASQSNWIFYDELDDIFANKDGRLWATVMYPGSTFGGQPIQFQAGVYVWNGSSYDREAGGPGSLYEDGGLLTGNDGPVPAQDYISNTGFYIRKHADASDATLNGSSTWWVMFRLGEVYLNAAEAALELGLEPEALGYVNELRERAGFPANSLTSLTLEKIQQERWSELAFEDHRLWDLRRWRIAHELWDGTATSTTANVYNLYPYRIVRPGHPNHNKYVYDKFQSTSQGAPRFFRLGNYYAAIPDDVVNANPEIVRNPFH